MDIARQKLKEELEIQRQLEEVYNTTDVSPQEANLEEVPDDSHIAVTPKSTKGKVLNFLINIQNQSRLLLRYHKLKLFCVVNLFCLNEFDTPTSLLLVNL